MNKSSIVKLRNYFSDRIKEIKDGSYVPTYEQIKELPEFSGIKRETFRIARKRWYSQHFRMTSIKFSERLENIKAGYISENKFAARLENIKGGYISEEEYDKEPIRGNRKSGFCISIIGAFFIMYGLLMGGVTGWNPSYVGGYFAYVYILGVPGIILLVIGLILVILYYSKKT